MSRLQGQLALVTGGSRGIGAGICQQLAAAGAEVIVAARGKDGAVAVAEKINASGGKAHGIALDISNDENVENSKKEILDQYGKISLLVNNAGITRDNIFLRMKAEEWDAVMQTNLNGVYRTCRAFVPTMIRARYGRIVNITSVVGHIGNPGQTNYCATKAAVEGFTRSLAREIASRNVTVNCVAPGFIDTDMTKALPDETRAALLAQVPLNRLGTADDVAAATKFLLSDDAAYITGTTLHVNGGMYM